MKADAKVREIRKIATDASEWYAKNLKGTLETKCNEINGILKQFAEEHAPEFHLVHQNESSKKIDLWMLSSRVKGESNLAEKIIRNQEFYNLDLSSDTTSRQTILANNDDIIGLRYLVSLSCDCDSVFQMICAYEDYLKGKQITFSNLASNPEVMHNGRKIYRLKGCYEGDYPFELQIKSKIDSAWADEEHMLFYKESKYSYIQKSHRAIMNQVGELLEQADKMMVLIRNSHDDLTEDEVEEMEFYKKMENRYAPCIKDALSNTILLKQYRKALHYYFMVWGSSTRELILRKMEETTPLMTLQGFKVNQELSSSNLWKNYEKLKENCLEYILAEHISSDWMTVTRVLGAPMTMKRMNAYISKITECICLHLFENSVEDTEEAKKFSAWLGQALKDTLSEDNISFEAPVFIVDEKKLYMLYSYWKALGQKGNLKKEYRNSIDSCVIRYMLNPADGYASGQLQKIRTEIDETNTKNKSGFMRILSKDFADDIAIVYNESRFTSTGKVRKENILLALFQSLE